MNQDDNEIARHFGVSNDEVAQSKPKEMSRGAQTAWIVAAILIVGLVVGRYMQKPHPLERDAECSTFIGLTDLECRAQASARRVRGY